MSPESWAAILSAVLAAGYAIRLTLSPRPDPKALLIHELLRHGGE